MRKQNERNANNTSKQRNAIVSTARNGNYNFNDIFAIETTCQTATLTFYIKEEVVFIFISGKLLAANICEVK